MRFTLCGAMLAVVVLSVPLHAEEKAPTGMQLTPGAGLIEIVPPAPMQQSPAAVDLIDRLIRKHILLLQQPALVKQVLQNPDAKGEFRKANDLVNTFVKAIRVRVIPDTNVIEVSIDPGFAGTDASMLAETLVNQHLQNEQLMSQNVQLERSVMLNNLKQRYQFRKDELGRDLREKMVRLSIDGMGTPGRLSAKEVELNNLLQMSFEMERKKAEASGDGAKAIEKQLTAIHERIDSTKADLGDLTNAMNQYLTLKDDETTTRELLKSVNQQLEQISQGLSAEKPEVRWLCRPSKG